MIRPICFLALLLSASALTGTPKKKHHAAKEPTGIKLTTHLAEEGTPVRQRLKSDEGMAYYGTLHVGGQAQNSIYDTGSFDVVLESQCTKEEEENNKAQLQDKDMDLEDFFTSSIKGNPWKSAHVKECCSSHKCPYAGYNKKNSGVNYFEEKDVELEEIVYGSGPVTVRPGFDHIAIKDSQKIGSGSSIEAAKMPVRVIVDHEVDLFQETDMQAIVGIGPGEWDDRKNRMNNKLGIKRFMVCFQEDANADGFMTWNDKDRTHDENWVTVPVPGQIFWAVPTSDFKMVGKPGFLGLKQSDEVGCQPSCGGIIDTGTSLITPPPEVVDTIQSSLENGDITDCSDLSKFPTFQFKLGDKELSLPPESYIADAGYTEVFLKHRFLGLPTLPMTKTDYKLVKKARKTGNHQTKVRSCVLLLSPNDEPEETQYGPMVIFGMSLFRKYAVQFDLSGDVEGKKHTSKAPTRFLHLAEAAPDCEGPVSGGRFKQKRKTMQTVKLNKIRISPLQQRVLPKRTKELKGLKMKLTKKKGILRI